MEAKMIIAQVHNNVEGIVFYWRGSGHHKDQHELIAVKVIHIKDGRTYPTITMLVDDVEVEDLNNPDKVE